MARGVGLQLRGLGHRYGTREVLSSIDLNVEPGEFLAVVGRSGSGKTTLLRILAGLEVGFLGEVFQDGVPLRGLNPRARLMFQEPRLLPWERVEGNVALGLPRDRIGRVSETLREVGLLDRARDWPTKLSGGQQQRVALARALAGEPGLLLLDEPLSSLDALTRIEMQILIERVWQSLGFTAVLVTHDVEEAITLADRVLVIEHGRVAADRRIPLPRPRRRDSPPFASHAEAILSLVLHREPTTAGEDPSDEVLAEVLGEVDNH